MDDCVAKTNCLQHDAGDNFMFSSNVSDALFCHHEKSVRTRGASFCSEFHVSTFVLADLSREGKKEMDHVSTHVPKTFGSDMSCPANSEIAGPSRCAREKSHAQKTKKH